MLPRLLWARATQPPLGAVVAARSPLGWLLQLCVLAAKVTLPARHSMLGLGCSLRQPPGRDQLSCCHCLGYCAPAPHAPADNPPRTAPLSLRVSAHSPPRSPPAQSRLARAAKTAAGGAMGPRPRSAIRIVSTLTHAAPPRRRQGRSDQPVSQRGGKGAAAKETGGRRAPRRRRRVGSPSSVLTPR